MALSLCLSMLVNLKSVFFVPDKQLIIIILFEPLLLSLRFFRTIILLACTPSLRFTYKREYGWLQYYCQLPLSCHRSPPLIIIIDRQSRINLRHCRRTLPSNPAERINMLRRSAGQQRQQKRHPRQAKKKHNLLLRHPSSLLLPPRSATTTRLFLFCFWPRMHACAVLRNLHTHTQPPLHQRLLCYLENVCCLFFML